MIAIPIATLSDKYRILNLILLDVPTKKRGFYCFLLALAGKFNELSDDLCV
jgi:hypothetical protein